MKKETKIWTTIGSTYRPGWNSDNLHAYRDRRSSHINGSTTTQKDYYVKTKGLRS